VERPSPEPWLLRAAGWRRGAPDYQRRLRGPGATARGKPGSGGAAEGPPAAGRRRPGLGFPHPGTFSSHNFSVLKSEDSTKII